MNSSYVHSYMVWTLPNIEMSGTSNNQDTVIGSRHSFHYLENTVALVTIKIQLLGQEQSGTSNNQDTVIGSRNEWH